MSVTAVASQGRAMINIVDTISTQTDASSKLLSQKVDGFLSMGIRVADVYVNSDGGSVFEAVEIVNQLNRFGAGNVRITVGAMAASAATYITSSFHTEAESEASRFMIHFPQSASYGTASELRTQLRLLESIEDEYCAKYAAKTGKSKEAVKEMLSKGDVWMTAREALAHGLIDGIKSAPSKMPSPAPSMAALGSPAVNPLPAIAARAGGLTHGQAQDIWERSATARENDPDLDATIYESLIRATVADRGAEPHVDHDDHHQRIAMAQDIWERTAGARQRDPTLEDMVRRQVAVLTDPERGTITAMTYDEALAGKAPSVMGYLDGDMREYETLYRDDPYECQRMEYEYFRTFPNGNTLSPKQEKNLLRAMGAKAGWTLEDYLMEDFDGYQEMRDAHPELARILEHANVG